MMVAGQPEAACAAAGCMQGGVAGEHVEQGLAPVKALELKILHNVLRITNVRFAGEAHC